MAAIINAMDNFTPSQIGENGHVEYGWSNSMREKILQLSFQLTRTDESGINNLQNILTDILKNLKCQTLSSKITDKENAKDLLSILYRMIGHTRDIIDGKGEYTLSYMMIYTWYEYYPELSKFALKCLVDLGDKKVHQYGSWKDMKYFCEYVRKQTNQNSKEPFLQTYHPLIQEAISLVNEQLKKDDISFEAKTLDVSLASKWAPREKSAFGWVFQLLATDYYSDYIRTALDTYNQPKAILKCKTQYRKLLSKLNVYIDTIQIKQCSKKWSEIDFNKVTSITISKQKKAFLNIEKDGSIRHPEIQDRIECAEHFNAHIQRAVKGETEMKGKRVGMADFTKEALQLLVSVSVSEAEKALLNSQWRDNSSQTNALGNVIAMVDVSGSMNGDPMNAAIALGIRVAEKSAIGKRVMTFSENPTWVNLEPYTDFISQVQVLQNAPWGANTNFHIALDLILDAIIQNNMPAVDVQDMVLIILSDMQMDEGDRCNKQSLYETMQIKYENAGIRVHGKPYKPPHILFWNLRSTRGFPCLSIQPNVSMMSGFSPALLNLFCEKGISALKSCTPWSIFVSSLENERYNIMSERLNDEIK